MSDPSHRAMVELGALLDRSARVALTSRECMAMVDAVRWVPGYLKRVAHALSDQRSSAGFEGLLALPPTIPGVVEGLHAAVLAGICRTRRDGTTCRPLLALDFRPSRARWFEDLLIRIRSMFGDRLESLEVAGKIHHRFVIDGDRGTLAGKVSAVAHDLQYVHVRLSRLASTRLWINGWRFATDASIRAPAQGHLLRAWLSWAATQVQTRA